MTAPTAEESRALLEGTEYPSMDEAICHVRAALDREDEALARAEKAEASAAEWAEEYRSIRKLHDMVKGRAVSAYAERDAARAEADRLREAAQRLLPYLDWQMEEGGDFHPSMPSAAEGLRDALAQEPDA